MKNLILHKCIQDIKRHKFLTILWLSFCTIHIIVDSQIEQFNFFRGLDETLIASLSLIYLISAITLSILVLIKDPLFDDQAFWLTKPITNKDLFFSKIIFLGVTVVIFPTFLTLAVNLFNGFGIYSIEISFEVFLLHLLALLLLIYFTSHANDLQDFFIIILSTVTLVSTITWLLYHFKIMRLNVFSFLRDESGLIKSKILLLILFLIIGFVILNVKNYIHRNKKESIKSLASLLGVSAIVLFLWPVNFFESYYSEEKPFTTLFQENALSSALKGYNYLGDYPAKNMFQRSQNGISLSHYDRTHFDKYIPIGKTTLKEGSRIVNGRNSFEIISINKGGYSGTIKELKEISVIHKNINTLFSPTHKATMDDDFRLFLINEKTKEAISLRNPLNGKWEFHFYYRLNFFSNTRFSSSHPSSRFIIQDNFGYKYKSQEHLDKHRSLSPDLFAKTLKRNEGFQMTDEWLRDAVLVIYRKEWQEFLP